MQEEKTSGHTTPRSRFMHILAQCGGTGYKANIVIEQKVQKKRKVE
jgi:predicted mannosyl-3-phosphoglycerate phosphatase (HAD superfamily)